MWTAVRESVRVGRRGVVPAQAGAPVLPRHVFVLSGGGARGAAQAGALAVLLHAGIAPAGIVGCSVGALNGAFLAADPSAARADDLAERWTSLRRGDVFGGSRLATVRNVVARRPALFSSDPLRRLVTQWLPVDTFDDLAVPLRVVTTSLTSGRAVYHARGPLTEVLLASAALPGLFPPVHLPAGGGTEQHVDGGVTDLVPVAGAVDLAPTDVWLLDVAAAPGTGSWRVRSALDVLVASLAASMRCRPLPRLDGVRLHHLELGTPADGPAGLMDFTRAAELVEVGREVATSALARLAVPAA
jgi:NTE family protein